MQRCAAGFINEIVAAAGFLGFTPPCEFLEDAWGTEFDDSHDKTLVMTTN